MEDMAASTVLLHAYMSHHSALVRKDVLHGCNVASCCKPEIVLHVAQRLFDDSSPPVYVEAPHYFGVVAFRGSRHSGHQMMWSNLWQTCPAFGCPGKSGGYRAGEAWQENVDRADL